MVDASRVWFICFGFFFSPLVPSPVSKVLRDPGATAALDVNASIQKKEWFVCSIKGFNLLILLLYQGS